MKFFLFWATFISLSVFAAETPALPPPTSAPPPWFILNEVMTSHDGIKNLALEARVTDLRTNQVFKEVLKVDFLSGRVAASYLSEKDEPLGGVDTQLKNLHRLGKFWLGVALDPNGPRFYQALQELNVLPHEKTQTKLSRMGNIVSWMWGQESEIQFLKDDFLALDYRSGGTGSSAEELLLKEYGSSAVRVPKNVWVRLQNKDVYHFELKGMKTNQTLKYPAVFNEISQPSVKEWTLLVR